MQIVRAVVMGIPIADLAEKVKFDLRPRVGEGLRAAVVPSNLPRMIRRLALAALVCLLALPASAAVDRPAVERQFQAWLAADLWSEAKAVGVTRLVFDRAFAGVTLDWSMPELQPPGAPPTLPPNTAQTEFGNPGAYFNEAGLARLVTAGNQRLAQWKQTLAAVTAKYGVPAPILIAIWAKESGFGSESLPKLAIPALATEAFIGLRKDTFRAELIAALSILQRGDITPDRMRSSWAGALGQPQIMPSQFLISAVDFDGNGRADIWNSVPDSLATMARFLMDKGWQAGRRWGVEARVPSSVACTLDGPDQGKPVSAWAKLGVTRADGRPLPADAGRDYLVMPAGRFGPAFIVTDNFYVLKTYNNSDLYALYIGHLADRLSANRPFIGKWTAPSGFTRADVKVMQDALVAKGYDVGKPDGLVGYKTRIAIGVWQTKHGRARTCWPDATLVKSIR